jgi:hypothetical protein
MQVKYTAGDAFFTRLIHRNLGGAGVTSKDRAESKYHTNNLYIPVLVVEHVGRIYLLVT